MTEWAVCVWCVRFYHGPIFWNYGLLPQTWENPNIEHHEVSTTMMTLTTTGGCSEGLTADHVT